MYISFGLLASAIAAAWLPSLRFRNGTLLPLWTVLLAGAVLAGFATGYVTIAGAGAIAAFWLFAWRARHPTASAWQRIGCGILTALFALALATHRIPGFNNPVLLAGHRFSSDSVPFAQYANFDKGVVAVILLALFNSRAASWKDFRAALPHTILVGVVTTTAVIVTALAMEYVRPDLKLPSYTLTFLLVNLFFTICAEESFFRGVIQTSVLHALKSRPHAGFAAITASSLLFGAAHLPAGTQFAFLATIAGFGYSYAWHVSKRIESPILVHFALNTIHFIAFSYPHLQ